MNCPYPCFWIYAKINIVNSAVEVEIMAIWLAIPTGLVVRKSLGKVRIRSSGTQISVGTVSIGIPHNCWATLVKMAIAVGLEIEIPVSRSWRSIVSTFWVRVRFLLRWTSLMMRSILLIGIPKLTSPISNTMSSIFRVTCSVVSAYLFEPVFTNIISRYNRTIVDLN